MDSPAAYHERISVTDAALEAQLSAHRSRRRRELAARARRRRDTVHGLIVGGGLAAVCVYLGAGGVAWPH